MAAQSLAMRSSLGETLDPRASGVASCGCELIGAGPICTRMLSLTLAALPS